ncbi:hypothetical protein HXX76_008770 [Chlamydomonas incerta]|uniref:Uncharacterized protein n=1 Tax=Chlamydomonas incerta TaxID=51695 RepID=A0A835STX3_CHLIN|nr:hypothetical protein HXX76_008770 [Chlamydomonas incerta]|eukprot:KAG2433043.1 hypothetical protein HXX76_008770 [Chlamydomonas incerta]
MASNPAGGGELKQRKAPRIPVGLALKEHKESKERYWAVVAMQAMPSGGVSILNPYSEIWQKPRKGSIAFTFVDELKAHAPDLAGFTVHVTKEWMEACFVDPSWEELAASPVRVLGATVGIMTGLLPPEGVPINTSGKGRRSPPRGKAAAALNGAGPEGFSSMALLRQVLPMMLLNAAIVAGVWILANLQPTQQMATLGEPAFQPGPLDPGLAQRRTDQATAKFLPELLNSREFCERYEIRRRPAARARFTSRLLWAFAGAVMLLLAALAFAQLRVLLGGDAHNRETAPPEPKVTPPPPPPPPPPASSPLSATSLDLRFRCGQWQPPVQQQGWTHARGTAGIDATTPGMLPLPDGAQPEPAEPHVTEALLAALTIVSVMLLLALALLAAVAVRLAAPVSAVLPSAGPAGAAAEVDPDGSKAPSAGPPAASPSSTAVSHTPAITADAAQALPTADSRPIRSPAPRPQQLQPATCSPVTHSPMESAAASGGTWSSGSGGGGADDCELDAVLVGAAAASSAGLSAAQQVKAPAAQAGAQAPDTAPAGMWAQFETPSRAPSFRDQLPPLPEVLAVSSVPASDLQPQGTAAPQPQARGGQAIAPQKHAQPSTPSAGTTAPSSAAIGAAGGRSRLPSVLRSLVAYGSTAVAQAPAIAIGDGAPCAAATPSAVSDGASPPLDATFSAAPWPFAYPDSVERARLTATPTASTTSTSGSEGVRAAAAAAAAALTPAVWSGTAGLPASGGGKDQDSGDPIFDLSRYDSNGDELPLLPPLSAAAVTPQPLTVLPDPITAEESAASGDTSAAADGGAGRQPPHHRWRLVKQAVALKLHGSRRTATDTSAHRDSQQVAGSASGGSASGSSGGGLASGAAVNAALQAAADAPPDQAVGTPRPACAAEQQLQRGASLTLQLPEAADMETPVWPPLHGRQARRAGAAAAEADPAGLEGGGACGGGDEEAEEVESSGRFAAEALTLADCLSAARGTCSGGAVKAAGAEADVGPLGAWSFCGEPAADFSKAGIASGVLLRPVPGPTAAAAHSPSISSLLPPPAFARASEASREHAAAAAAAVATLQSLKLSARRLVEATRAGSYWRPQDGPEPAGGAAGDQELRAAQTELHAAASQLKQLRLTAPCGSAPAAAAPARKALAFTPAATPFAGMAAGAGSAAAGSGNRSSDSWASLGSCVVPPGARQTGSGCGDNSAAPSVSDSFLVTPAPRAPPVAPLPVRRSKIPLLTPASGSVGGAASPSLVQARLGKPAVGDDVAATPIAAGAHAASTPNATAASAGGLSSILAEVADAAAAKATQAGQLSPADLAPPGNNELTGETRRLRYGLPRLVPWPALATPESQQSRPPAPAPTPATGTAAALPCGLPTSAGSDGTEVRILDEGGRSTRSSSDGSAGTADFNEEDCQPPAEEVRKDHSDASPDSSSPACFHLAGHELPSDAEVQAFLAAAARSQSPAGAATAAPPPPLSPLESLLRVLPAAVEVLVVQLCALADLAAERQREVLAWHATAAAQAMLMHEADKDAPAAADADRSEAAEAAEAPQFSYGRGASDQQVLAGSTSRAAGPASAQGPVPQQGAEQLVQADLIVSGPSPGHGPPSPPRAAATRLPQAAAAPDLTPGAVLGLSPVARCDSAEGRELMALIGHMVDEVELEQGPGVPQLGEGLDAGTADLQGTANGSQGRRAAPGEPTWLPPPQQQQQQVADGPLFEVPLDGGSHAPAVAAWGSDELPRSLAVALDAPPAREDANIVAMEAEDSDGAVAQGGDSDESEAPATAEGDEGDAEYVVVYGLVESMRTPRARHSGSRTSSMAATPVVAGERSDGSASACVSATGLAASACVAPPRGSDATCSHAVAAPAAAAHEAWALNWAPWPSPGMPTASGAELGVDVPASEAGGGPPELDSVLTGGTGGV